MNELRILKEKAKKQVKEKVESKEEQLIAKSHLFKEQIEELN